ncbi:MAG: ribose 5-phosphate isomerase B [Armatimonadota bacterium]
MKIAVGSDHGGYDLKHEILDALRSENYEYRDFGTHSKKSVDYPDIAREVSEAVASGEYDRGILICGTGVGMCITANKVRGIRAVLASDEYTARLSREHNNTNVLTLGGRVIGPELAKNIVHVWLETDFSTEPRHIDRVNKIEQ